MRREFLFLTAVFLSAGCAETAPDSEAGEAAETTSGRSWDAVQTDADRVGSVGGLSGPEAVRYDADQDVWFIANFGEGNADARDGDGFITRVDAATGEVSDLRFAMGTTDQPLHMPRGMFITGDTLWAADVDGVHAFDRRSGAALGFIDFAAHDPGFLNDITRGPDGALYVTDTGRSSLLVIRNGVVSEALPADEALGSPNGVTWDAEREVFILVPWTPGHPVHAWAPGGEVMAVGTGTPGRLDGVEAYGGRLLVASQTDSTLQAVTGSGTSALIRMSGAPADIGVDTRRGRVAVPYIALNRVDIWELPGA